VSNDPPAPPETPEDGAPDEAPDDAPATPEAILEGLRIMVHPKSIRWARQWSTILYEVSQGATQEDACAIARVPIATWKLWKKKGRGRRKPSFVAPIQPYADLARALDETLATVRAEVRKSRLTMARGGDTRAMEMILTEPDAMRTAHARASVAMVQADLVRVQIERERVALEAARVALDIERIKLERMQGGGADTTVDIGDTAMWAELQKKAFGATRQGMTADGAGHHPTGDGVAAGELPPLSAPLDPR